MDSKIMVGAKPTARKILIASLATALALSAFALTGCGGSQPAAQKDKPAAEQTDKKADAQKTTENKPADNKSADANTQVFTDGHLSMNVPSTYSAVDMGKAVAGTQNENAAFTDSMKGMQGPSGQAVIFLGLPMTEGNDQFSFDDAQAGSFENLKATDPNAQIVKSQDFERTGLKGRVVEFSLSLGGIKGVCEGLYLDATLKDGSRMMYVFTFTGPDTDNIRTEMENVIRSMTIDGEPVDGTATTK